MSKKQNYINSNCAVNTPADVPPPIYLHENIRYLRETNNLCQNKVAEYLHICRSTYSYYESGKVCPSISSLIILSKLFQVTIDELILKNCSDSLFQPACKRNKHKNSF